MKGIVPYSNPIKFRVYKIIEQVLYQKYKFPCTSVFFLLPLDGTRFVCYYHNNINKDGISYGK